VAAVEVHDAVGALGLLVQLGREDDEILRPAPTEPLAAARRKAETLRFARRAARRLTALSDPGYPAEIGFGI